jgi:asparagine synthase (glutamine-hydrolysing)
MCGFAGMCGPAANSQLADKMLQSILHRGPDGSAMHEDAQIVLAHCRLSVIDLETGDQPMTNEDRSIWVAYNGEIYNFRELRKELEQLGYRFRTTSDTEVLVHGYHAWQDKLLPRLDGMFAFAIWDAPARRLLLARDAIGIKPLHYHFDGATLRFASEIKALLQDPALPRQVDFQSLHWFLNLRFIPSERTLFEGIHRLLPGHALVFQGGTIENKRYVDLTPAPDKNLTEPECLDGIRHHLREAVRRQIISDVPLGAYLSGGLDSSAIVAMMSELGVGPIRTFSVGFNEPTDELDDARLVAKHFGTEHHELSLQPDPLREYPRVIWAAEEPKENILQGYLLAEFARRGVKVALSGLGGDELFAGYHLHRYLRPADPLHGLVPRGVRRCLNEPLGRLITRMQQKTGMLRLDEYRRGLELLLSIGDPSRYYLILRNVWDHHPSAFAQLYGPAWEGRELAGTDTQFARYFQPEIGTATEQALWAEMNTKLVDDFLMNEDRTSMAHGLEVRVPFLDRDLVRFGMSIPIQLRMRRGRMKALFRKAMAPLLPEETLRKKKWGFSFNPYYQFQKDLKRVAERVLTRERVEETGWFNYAFLQAILRHPPHPRLRWHYFMLWLALGLEIWRRMFIDGDVENPTFDLEAYY